MKKISILMIMASLLLIPGLSFATSSSSQNYQMTDQVDFSGGSSTSENYQVFGIVTDMNQLVLWPDIPSGNGGDTNTGDQTQNGIPITIGPMIELEKITPLGGETIALGGLFNIQLGRGAVLGQLASELNIPLATAGLILTLIVLVLSQLFGGIAILSLFSSAWSWFLALFDFGDKKDRYGMVYDAEANAPIARAVVQIFESEYNKLLSTQVTDKDGRFLLFVDPGKYYIKVIKSNYKFPSKFTFDGYHGAPFVVNQKQELLYKIPMDPDHEVLAHRIGILSGLVKFFNIIRIPVIILGTVFSIVALYDQITTLNIVVACLYLVIWIVELYKLRKTKPYGTTKDKSQNAFIDRVILRLFDERNKLVSTQISDSHGRYSFLTNPGSYKVTAVKNAYEQYVKDNLIFRKSGRINLDVFMEKEKPRIRIIPTVYESAQDNTGAHNVDDNMHPSWV